ncbi:MAG: 50S ribosomal protein L17 [Deltaproteobacteria bacterium]|nr:MAG: 50S ribosomal protein L17 [Deltaproteobacteria bacterium]
MRHRKSGRKLGRNSSHRKAMFRNMVTSLLRYEQIRTTEAKAKELRGYVERVITLARRAPSVAQIEALSGEEQSKARAARVHAIRRARLWVNDREVLRRLFGDYADRFADRPGGYTRVIKAGRRPGDNAPMAIIELVEAVAASVASVEEPVSEEVTAE